MKPNYVVKITSGALLERMELIDAAVETRFFEIKNKMPKSVIRKSNGDVKIQDRHSNIPFNYLFRKICEALDIYDFHNELPLLRSSSKLHNLDDITSIIFNMIGLKFRRSVVIRRPKMRKKKRSKRNHKKKMDVVV